METELSHSFNIQLSSEISTRLAHEQEKLKNAGFVERRAYDSSPHLAVATKFMGERESDSFLETLRNEFKDDSAFEIEFSHFAVSNTGDYIFLHLSKDSEQKLLQLHERAFSASKDVGLEIQTGKTFRHFDYNPHISIIKLLPEEIEGALKIIQEDFAGIKMLVTEFEITRQEIDEKGFSNFPVVLSMRLS